MTKPTIEEIAEHFKLIGVNESGIAEKFYWYYESTGWMIGKKKMAAMPDSATPMSLKCSAISSMVGFIILLLFDYLLVIVQPIPFYHPFQPMRAGS